MKLAATILAACFALSAIGASARASAQLTKPNSESTVIQPGSPKHTEQAKKEHLEGIVYVRALVSRDGKIIEAKVEKSSSPVFNAAALEAAKASTFEPALKDGKAVEVWITIPYEFALAEKAKGK